MNTVSKYSAPFFLPARDAEVKGTDFTKKGVCVREGHVSCL